MSSFDQTRSELANKACSIIVFGASGHLAKTKTYPSLFDIYLERMLPDDFNCIGYGRSALKKSIFHQRISQKLSGDDVSSFLSHCTYFKGKSYGDEESLKQLNDFVCEQENAKYNGTSNRLFYLAVPPEVFGEICHGIKKYLSKPKRHGWTRVIIEKPFGSDSESCQNLMQSVNKHFSEREIYRVDHYLAKEMVQNLLSFRFSNSIWQNVWNQKYIKFVKICLNETIGIEGRGGYYEQNGVIRDIFQNHLLQILSLIAMEAPNNLSDDSIRDCKVKALECIKGIKSNLTIVGQYDGYRQDETTNDQSNQITYAQSVLFLDNFRWHNVPFICECGKALNEKKVEVRIVFKSDFNLFGNCKNNELVIRIQPNPKIFVKTNVKKIGFSRFDELSESVMELSYKRQFADAQMPKAYTRLIMDCLRGDQSLFVRGDELKESWRIVTPFLKELEAKNEEPNIYKIGSNGPVNADMFEQKYDNFNRSNL